MKFYENFMLSKALGLYWNKNLLEANTPNFGPLLGESQCLYSLHWQS
jgi:hypothetical protein